MKPRKNYRTRPKKTGGKKKQRVAAQKRRLVAAGYDKVKLDKLTTVEVRELQKKAGKKKGSSSPRKRTAKAKAKVSKK